MFPWSTLIGNFAGAIFGAAIKGALNKRGFDTNVTVKTAKIGTAVKTIFKKDKGA